MPRHARRHSDVNCAKMAERIEMTFELHVDSGGPKEACIRWVTQLRHLANTGAYMCGGNAAFAKLL